MKLGSHEIWPLLNISTSECLENESLLELLVDVTGTAVLSLFFFFFKSFFIFALFGKVSNWGDLRCLRRKLNKDAESQRKTSVRAVGLLRLQPALWLWRKETWVLSGSLAAAVDVIKKTADYLLTGAQSNLREAGGAASLRCCFH